MRKIWLAAAAAVMMMSMSASAETMKIAALKGPTAMGMVKMMDEADQAGEEAEREFTIVSAVDEVPPMLAQGTVDIAAVPANLAAILYNKTEGAIQVAAVNTLGVLYICDNGEAVTSIADLEGKTVYASGKGATPEFALNYILKGNGLDPEKDVTIEWKSEHAECLAALLADEGAIAMLPQPFVTTAQIENPQVRPALDLTEEWDKLQEGAEDPSGMITGVAVVRKAFAEENPEAVAAFLEDYAASTVFANTNVEDAAALIGGYGIVPTPVAQVALPQCHIVCVTGEEMAEMLSGYLDVLAGQDPTSVGGKVPAEDFYYVG